MATDLFVSTYAPLLENGRALRTYMIVRALAASRSLEVAYVPHGGDGPSAEYRAIPGVTFHRIDPSRGLRRAATVARRRLEGVPTHIARACSPEVVDRVDELVAAPDRGRVITSDFSAMTMLLGLAARRPVVYSAHNVESSYGGAYYSARQLAGIRRHEQRILEVASESWMVSELDLRRARELAPSGTYRYVPNVVDAQAIEPLRAPDDGQEALMIGDFTYPPNLLGLRWLVGEVLEHVWRELPDARLRVVGRGIPDEQWDPRVDVRGFVDELRDAYRGVKAVVVPLTESGGTPLKFVEALAYGLPVVATPLAAQGLAAEADVHFRSGADPRAFAGHIVELLRDGDPAMAARARELVVREYSLEMLIRLLAPSGE